jgi:signal transduction histidine kinase
LALDCLPDPSLLIDDAETVLYVNKAYEDLSGFRYDEVSNKPLIELVEPDGATAEASSALCRTHSGFVSLRATIRPMAGALGGTLRLVRLEQAAVRRSLVDELSAGLDIQGEFLVRVSHELRTPLTAMQEGIDVVLDGLTGPLNDQQVEFLQLARRNMRRLNRLVADTLEYDRLKRNEPSRPLAKADLELLVRGCVDRYESVELTVDPRAERLWAEVAAPCVRDAVEKVIQNAIRHGGGTVSVALRRKGSEAIIEIADSGRGIPQEKLAEIFGEFEQLSTGPGRTVGGVGLGLTIARLIIAEHGGRIWADSKLGRGSCFFIALKTCPAPTE